MNKNKTKTWKALCAELGCTISQFGYAEFRRYFNRNNIAEIYAWASWVKNASGGKFPTRIIYHQLIPEN